MSVNILQNADHFLWLSDSIINTTLGWLIQSIMLRLSDAQTIIEKEFSGIRLPREPEGLYEPIRYILSNGGKRIRPALVLLGGNVFADEITPAIPPALGIEVFHNFTLLHDDLMDNSGIRRGKETVHVKWDDNTAILSGDAMSILAGKLVSEVNPEILREVMDCYNQTALEVCEGQMLDMNFEDRFDVSEAEYLRMIELKTSVLIAASLKIGALVCGSGTGPAEELYNFGRDLGIAFQLQDDYLDTFGDEELFGKPVGNDIINNKKTILMITCLREASRSDKDELLHWIRATGFLPSEKVEKVKGIFQKYKIPEMTSDLIHEYYKRASIALDGIKVKEDRKAILREFSDNLMNRKY